MSDRIEWSGIDWGSGDTHVQAVRGAKFICEVPMTLGQVTALTQRNGKLVAETESGTPFIVPVPTTEK